jgi:hypothetical protein
VVPPRVHIFRWLLANNKTLARDNLAKRRNLNDKTCVFCSELESVNHLFFQCCVAQAMWSYVSDITNVRLGIDFESVTRFLLHGKKMKVLNVFSSMSLWTIWKSRNDICFYAS